ncbi:MAG: autotransporter outer membrane beta-barrel domain-containing protein [Emcibacteraceae bacterium]|nr:autotransporter outer membrane beta-barrel domain-containing protein [Emcibacteraceae bacterium]
MLARVVTSLSFRLQVFAFIAFVLSLAATNANAATYDAAGQWADFSNSSDIGPNPSVGDTFTYLNIFSGVDALVSITKMNKTSTNSGTAADGIGVKVDEKDPTLHSAWSDQRDMNVLLSGDGTGSETTIGFRFDFVQSGTSIPIIIENLSINIKDLEGIEFVEFSGLNSYVLSNTTHGSVVNSSGTYRVSGSSGSSNLADQDHWVEATYSAANSVTINIGRDANGAVNGSGRFAISFQSETWSSPVTTATPLPTRNIVYNANSATSGTTPSTTSGAGVLTIAGNTGNLTKSNLAFSSWNTLPNGTGVTLNAGDSYTPSSDITIYAQYGVLSPTTKTDVIGTGIAVFNTAINFSKTSITSVSNRLSFLRNNKDPTQTSRQGIKLSFADPLINMYLDSPEKSSVRFDKRDIDNILSHATHGLNAVSSSVKNTSAKLAIAELKDKSGALNLNPSTGPLIGDWSIWSEGQVTIGKTKTTDSASGQSTNGGNIAIGIDGPFGNFDTVGTALNIGKNDVNVGSLGSGFEASKMSLSVYSYKRLENNVGVEAQVGIGNMSFKTSRVDTPQILVGRRNAKMIFGSLAVVDEAFKFNDVTIVPHARAEWAHIELNGYVESGGTLALSYDKQVINRQMLSVGLDLTSELNYAGKTVKPFVGVKYGLDITPDSNMNFNYLGNSEKYSTKLKGTGKPNYRIEMGVNYKNKSGTTLSFAFEHDVTIGAAFSNSAWLKLSIPLGG